MVRRGGFRWGHFVVLTSINSRAYPFLVNSWTGSNLKRRVLRVAQKKKFSSRRMVNTIGPRARENGVFISAWEKSRWNCVSFAAFSRSGELGTPPRYIAPSRQDPNRIPTCNLVERWKPRISAQPSCLPRTGRQLSPPYGCFCFSLWLAASPADAAIAAIEEAR